MRTSQGPGVQDLWLTHHDSEVAGAISDTRSPQVSLDFLVYMD